MNYNEWETLDALCNDLDSNLAQGMNKYKTFCEVLVRNIMLVTEIEKQYKGNKTGCKDSVKGIPLCELLRVWMYYMNAFCVPRKVIEHAIQGVKEVRQDMDNDGNYAECSYDGVLNIPERKGNDMGDELYELFDTTIMLNKIIALTKGKWCEGGQWKYMGRAPGGPKPARDDNGAGDSTVLNNTEFTTLKRTIEKIEEEVKKEQEEEQKFLEQVIEKVLPQPQQPPPPAPPPRRPSTPRQGPAAAACAGKNPFCARVKCVTEHWGKDRHRQDQTDKKHIETFWDKDIQKRVGQLSAAMTNGEETEEECKGLQEDNDKKDGVNSKVCNYIVKGLKKIYGVQTTGRSAMDRNNRLFDQTMYCLMLNVYGELLKEKSCITGDTVEQAFSVKMDLHKDDACKETPCNKCEWDACTGDTVYGKSLRGELKTKLLHNPKIKDTLDKICPKVTQPTAEQEPITKTAESAQNQGVSEGSSVKPAPEEAAAAAPKAEPSQPDPAATSPSPKTRTAEVAGRAEKDTEETGKKGNDANESDLPPDKIDLPLDDIPEGASRGPLDEEETKYNKGPGTNGKTSGPEGSLADSHTPSTETDTETHASSSSSSSSSSSGSSSSNSNSSPTTPDVGAGGSGSGGGGGAAAGPQGPDGSPTGSQRDPGTPAVPGVGGVPGGPDKPGVGGGGDGVDRTAGQAPGQGPGPGQQPPPPSRGKTSSDPRTPTGPLLPKGASAASVVPARVHNKIDNLSDLLTPYLPLAPVFLGTSVISYLLWKYLFLGKKRKRHRRAHQVSGPPSSEEQVMDHMDQADGPHAYTLVKERKQPRSATTRTRRPEKRSGRLMIIDIHLEVLDECQKGDLHSTTKNFFEILVQEFMGSEFIKEEKVPKEDVPREEVPSSGSAFREEDFVPKDDVLYEQIPSSDSAFREEDLLPKEQEDVPSSDSGFKVGIPEDDVPRKEKVPKEQVPSSNSEFREEDFVPKEDVPNSDFRFRE
ncbi:SICA antigen [Plasmodium coatneyi]|uniref:SICA antigen n=1 Tax=Plasmodium coatneyi TaxID=208452 RepID=A0A1B1E1H1_9APIC|nr:SICA antigen [Plasmodium coatneyi]ANQ08717.1 SICA antigen [Plasmodium coatneyi]